MANSNMRLEVDNVTPIRSYTLTVICCIVAVYGTFVAFHFTKNIWPMIFRSSSSDRHGELTMGAITRFSVVTSIICSFLASWIYVIARILVYTPYTFSDESCRMLCIVVLGCHLFSKGMTYGFFLHRLCDILGDSAVAYSPRVVYALCVLNTALTLTVVIISIFSASHLESAVYIRLDNAVTCASKGVDILFYIMVPLSAFLDVFWSVFVQYLLGRKLMVLVQESLKLNVSASTANILKTSRRITPKQVETFHRTSGRDNTLLLVVSKLTILSVVSATTSGVSCILAFFSITPAIFQWDVIINLSTLWLNFKFANVWFQRFQCNQLMRCVFPFWKTCAFSGGARGLCCNCCCCCAHDDAHATTTSIDLQSRQPVDSTSPATTPRSDDNEKSEFNESFINPQQDQRGPSRHRCCCQCCCDDPTLNLYHLASQEYELYLQEEMDTKDAQ